MDCEIKILGAPCGRHGPYTFHKAFSTTTLVRVLADRTPESPNPGSRTAGADVTAAESDRPSVDERTTPTSAPPPPPDGETESDGRTSCDVDNSRAPGDSDLNYVYRKQTRVLAISDFCVVRPWSDSALLCVAELQLLWTEHRGGGGGGAGGDRTLASLRLYVEPDSAPELNTLAVHGEDEVLAISEKVVLRLEDLVTWMTAAEDVPWTRGLPAMWYRHGGGAGADGSDGCQSRLLFDRQSPNSFKSEAKTAIASPVKCEDKEKNAGAICDGAVEARPAAGECAGMEFVQIKPEPLNDSPASEEVDKEQIQYVEKIDSLRQQNDDVKSKLGEMYEVKDFKDFKNKRQIMLSHSRLELTDVDKEKDNLVLPSDSFGAAAGTRVVVLSYSRYCRHRALAKRLEPSSSKRSAGAKLESVCAKLENVKIETGIESVKKEGGEETADPGSRSPDGEDHPVKCEAAVRRSAEDTDRSLAESLLMCPEMEEALIQALGGYVADDRNTKILFCRETFSYPDLETHEMLCNHLAPKLKGRPRGRRKKQILPIFSSAKKRQLLAVNLDKSKGRKINQDDDDDERRMLQMLAALSDSGGDGSGAEGGDGAGDSDDAGSEHMPCAATVARMTTGGGRQGLRCNSRKTPKAESSSATPAGSRKRKQSDNSCADNANNSDDEDSNDAELSPELERKAREYFERRLRDFNRDAMMDGYGGEKNGASGGGLQGVTNNSTGTKMAALMGDGKKLDMYLFYSSVQRLGGYDSVTASRQWRGIFEDLVARQESKACDQQQDGDDKSSIGSSNSDDKASEKQEEPKSSPAPNAASATVTRRHYEKSLLAFERFEQANNSSQSRSADSCRDPLALDRDSAESEGAPSGNSNCSLTNKSARQKLPKKPQNGAKSKDSKAQHVAKKKCRSASEGAVKKAEAKEILVQPNAVQPVQQAFATAIINQHGAAAAEAVPTNIIQISTSNIPTPTVGNQAPANSGCSLIQISNNQPSNMTQSNLNQLGNSLPPSGQYNSISKFYPAAAAAQFGPGATVSGAVNQTGGNAGQQQQQPPRTPTSSSLRSVRVKQDRTKQGQNAGTPPAGNSASPGRNPSPPAAKAPVAVAMVTSGGCNQNAVPQAGAAGVQQAGADSDDNDVIEVAYKPSTPEVIDLVDDDDEQQPNGVNHHHHQQQQQQQKCQNRVIVNPVKFAGAPPAQNPQVFSNPALRPPANASPSKQAAKPPPADVPSAYAAKRSKLEMLQQAGLEVTPVRQQHLLMQQQFQQPAPPPIPFNTQQFAFRSPAQQKTVYGNPRDVLTPQQMLMGGRYNNGASSGSSSSSSSPICLSVRGAQAVQPVQGVQDLSCAPQGALDLSLRPDLPLHIPIGGGDASKSSNLEITLVAKQNQVIGRPNQKRNSSGKFVKTPPAKSASTDLVIPRYQPQQQQQVRREVALDRSNSVSISLEKPRQPIASKPVANVPPYFVEPPHSKQQQVMIDGMQQHGQQGLSFNSGEQQLSKQQQQQPPPPAPGSYLQYLDPVFLSALCAATAQQQQNNHQQQNQQQSHQQQQAMLAAMLAAGLPITPATHEAMQLYGLLGLRLPSSQQHK